MLSSSSFTLLSYSEMHWDCAFVYGNLILKWKKNSRKSCELWRFDHHRMDKQSKWMLGTICVELRAASCHRKLIRSSKHLNIHLIENSFEYLFYGVNSIPFDFHASIIWLWYGMHNRWQIIAIELNCNWCLRVVFCMVGKVVSKSIYSKSQNQIVFYLWIQNVAVWKHLNRFGNKQLKKFEEKCVNFNWNRQCAFQYI